MTCIDGHAMARKGRAGAALCIAAVGSFVAGTFGVIVLTLIAPPLAIFALRFGPPVIHRLAGARARDLPRLHVDHLAHPHLADGVVRAAAGDHRHRRHDRPLPLQLRHSGVWRHGIGIVPVAVGLFGIGEILATPSDQVAGDVARPKLRELWPSRHEWRAAAMPIARGSVLGFLVGIIPGSAHIISSFISYALERRISKHPEEFGQGAVAGVAGPEFANNAASTGAFVPMLALGIPTGPVTAVLIAALLIHGVPPGPTLVNDHPKVFWGFVASMYVGNLMLLALNLPLVGLFVNLLRIPYAYLYPLIIMFCVIGVYEVNHSIVDVWIMLIMGVVGYLAAQVRIRSRAAGARPGHCAAVRDVAASIVDHVERQLGDLRAAPDRSRAADGQRRAVGARRVVAGAQQGLAQQARRGGNRRASLKSSGGGKPGELALACSPSDRIPLARRTHYPRRDSSRSRCLR